jgi:general secretion pathway protein I
LNKVRKLDRLAQQNNRSRRILASNSGFTLLETLVALAILTIGIAGVLHAFSSSMAASRAAESYSTACLLANQVAFALERETSIETGQLSGTFDDTPGYQWEANVDSADENGLMRTVITITWQTGKEDRHFDMAICLKPASNTEQQSTSSTASGSTGGA